MAAAMIRRLGPSYHLGPILSHYFGHVQILNQPWDAQLDLNPDKHQQVTLLELVLFWDLIFQYVNMFPAKKNKGNSYYGFPVRNDRRLIFLSGPALRDSSVSSALRNSYSPRW
jgi:hypothetical protein